MGYFDRVGSCFTPLDVACYDRYENLIPFPSTPKVNLQFKMCKGTLICVKKMKACLSADKKTLRIKVPCTSIYVRPHLRFVHFTMHCCGNSDLPIV